MFIVKFYFVFNFLAACVRLGVFFVFGGESVFCPFGRFSAEGAFNRKSVGMVSAGDFFIERNFYNE